MTLLDRIDAAVNNLCPCGAPPADGSIYCSDDCRPVRGAGYPVWMQPASAELPHPSGAVLVYPGLRALVCDWLRANGLDPDQIPVDSPIDVIGDYITVEYVVRDEHGGVRRNGLRAMTRRQRVPLQQQPPHDAPLAFYHRVRMYNVYDTN